MNSETIEIKISEHDETLKDYKTIDVKSDGSKIIYISINKYVDSQWKLAGEYFIVM